jgi:hypothetical protein
MHISLDSALGQQRRLNSVGESITQIAPDPAAAYSLRSLTGGDPKVVRVRRGSDNHEQDFTASDVSSGALQDFVNAQVVAPLDIQALSATGRDGDFLIAKAAYSLRSLGTRQATVTSSGDTDGDTSGKFVCQVRKDQTSNSDDTKSFTATEVSDGTLVDFVLGNTKSLLNSRAYFDGSNDNVKLTSEINLTGDFSLEYSFVVTEATQQIIGKETGGSYIRAQGTNGIHLFRIQTDGSAVNLTLTSTLKYSEANTIKLKRVSGKFGIYNESDVLISNESTLSDTFTVSSFGRARGGFAKGVIYNIRIDTNNDGTINHSYNGYGNTLSDWTDLVGSNNASAVNGSPALFTGQDQDGFVKTWYDQSVSDQAGDTATGNHATQATAANQPKIVSAGSLITGGVLFTGSSEGLQIASASTLGIDGSNNRSIFSVLKTTSGTDGFVPFGTDSSGGTSTAYRHRSSNTNGLSRVEIQGSGFEGADISDGNTHLFSSILDGTQLQNVSIFVDGSETSGSGTATLNTANNNFFIGSINGSLSENTGTLAELIVYASSQTDNRTAIEANIGEAYSIDLPSGVDPGFDQVDGFVETWYDQSGNGNNAVQATAANQPKIVSAGTLLNELDFDGTEDIALATGSFSLTQAYTTFSVSHADDASTAQGVWSTASSITGAFNAVSLFRNDDGFAVNSGTTITTAGTIDYVADRTYLQTNVVNGASSSIFVDGATGVTGNAGSTNPSGILILGFYRAGGGNQNLDGGIKELIIYDSDQTSTRSALETNIAAEYGITLS